MLYLRKVVHLHFIPWMISMSSLDWGQASVKPATGQ